MKGQAAAGGSPRTSAPTPHTSVYDSPIRAKPTSRSAIPWATAFQTACSTAATRVIATAPAGTPVGASAPARPGKALRTEVIEEAPARRARPETGTSEGALGVFVPSGVDRSGARVGRPWRRSVRTPTTLVVGQEAGAGRNPRRNHVLARTVRRARGGACRDRDPRWADRPYPGRPAGTRLDRRARRDGIGEVPWSAARVGAGRPGRRPGTRPGKEADIAGTAASRGGARDSRSCVSATTAARSRRPSTAPRPTCRS